MKGEKAACTGLEEIMAKPSHGWRWPSARGGPAAAFRRGAEAIPARQEAAERSIIKLRAKIAVLLRVARVKRPAATAATTTINCFRFCAGEELLRLFALACNHADVSVKIGVMSLSRFSGFSRGAVAVEQFPNIARAVYPKSQ